MNVRPLLPLDQIELVAMHPEVPFPDDQDGSWPCPGCGQRRPFQQAQLVGVVNRQPPRHERTVVVCRGCFDTLAAEAGHER